MNRRLIRSVRRKTDHRLIVPFGLELRPGDVVSVNRDGELRREGDVPSLLGVKVPPVRPPRSRDRKDVEWRSGRSVKVVFRADGEGSSLFDQLPAAGAKIDISFGWANGWVYAATAREIESLDGINGLRTAILESFRRGAWQPDFALIDSVHTAAKSTFLASETRGTKVVLKVSGQAVVTQPLSAQLTAGVSIEAASSALVKSISTRRSAIGVTGLRVRQRFVGTKLGDLDRPLRGISAEAASDAYFWADLDSAETADLDSAGI